MKIETRQEPNATIVSLAGRMDALTAPEFEKKMNKIIDEGSGNLVVDLKGIDYISSAGVRSILVIAKRLKTDSGRIVLAGLTDIVREVLEMTGFIKILTIRGSTEAALESL
jgi:anti-anti-sigma factor